MACAALYTLGKRNRRDFLWNLGGGLGGVALAQMLARDGLLPRAEAAGFGPGMRGGLHHAPRATRVVQLFMSGAASQCDTFDYKPLLIEKAGQQFDPGEKVELFQSQAGVVMPSPWAWKQRGQSGNGFPISCRTLPNARTTWLSCIRWSRSRMCTALRRLCRRRVLYCRVSRGWARGLPMGLAA